jgi:hypothetical protein
MAGGLQGAFGNFGQAGAPGFVPPTATAGIGLGAGTSLEAMANRYNQLGLANQGATPTSPGGGGPGTAELMDLGAAPSVTGGIPAEFQAVSGELQNAATGTQLGQQNVLSQIGPLLGAGGGLLGKLGGI